VILIPTSPEVIACIRIKHEDELTIFSSFSDPDGTRLDGTGETGEMMTEYCFKKSERPLFRIQSTWNISPSDCKRHNELVEYLLCIAEESDF